MAASEPRGCDDGDAEISEIQGENPKSATRKEVAITMLGSASIDNDGSEEDAGEDEKERRTESVPYLQPEEVQDDGGLGAAGQMVQDDERHGKDAHSIQCRNMFGSCVLLSYAGHVYGRDRFFALVDRGKF